MSIDKQLNYLMIKFNRIKKKFNKAILFAVYVMKNEKKKNKFLSNYRYFIRKSVTSFYEVIFHELFELLLRNIFRFQI